MLPLKSVVIQASLKGPHATLDIELTYLNESKNSALECTYEFPLDKDIVFGSLIAKIGEKEVVTKVKSKE